MAIRSRKKSRLKTKKLATIRQGDEIESGGSRDGLARAFEILANLPDDFLPRGRKDDQPQARDDISD